MATINHTFLFTFVLLASITGDAFSGNTDQFKLINTLKTDSEESKITCIAPSADGKYIAAGVGKEIMLWDIDKKKAIHTFERNSNNEGDFYKIRIIGEEKNIISLDSGGPGKIKIWSFKGELLQTFEIKEVEVKEEKKIYVFNTSINAELPKNLTVSLSDNNTTIAIFDSKTKKHYLKANKYSLPHLFEPKRMTSNAKYGIRTDQYCYRNLEIMNFETNRCRTFVTEHSDFILNFMFTNNDQYIISGCSDIFWGKKNEASIKIFNFETGKCTRTIKTPAQIFAVDPSNRYIASCDDYKSIKIWDFESGDLLQEITCATYIYSLEFSKNILFAANNDTISVYKLSNE